MKYVFNAMYDANSQGFPSPVVGSQIILFDWNVANHDGVMHRTFAISVQEIMPLARQNYFAMSWRTDSRNGDKSSILKTLRLLKVIWILYQNRIHDSFLETESQSPVAISDKTSYRKISWSLKATRLVVKSLHRFDIS